MPLLSHLKVVKSVLRDSSKGPFSYQYPISHISFSFWQNRHNKVTFIRFGCYQNWKRATGNDHWDGKMTNGNKTENWK